MCRPWLEVGTVRASSLENISDAVRGLGESAIVGMACYFAISNIGSVYALSRNDLSRWEGALHYMCVRMVWHVQNEMMNFVRCRVLMCARRAFPIRHASKAFVRFTLRLCRTQSYAHEFQSFSSWLCAMQSCKLGAEDTLTSRCVVFLCFQAMIRKFVIPPKCPWLLTIRRELCTYKRWHCVFIALERYGAPSMEGSDVSLILPLHRLWGVRTSPSGYAE